MSNQLLLLLILIIVLVGVFPRWSHSANWGYAPSGIITVILVIVLLKVLGVF